MAGYDSAARSRNGRIGANLRLARTSGHEVAAPARAGFLAKFEREVDPDGVLEPAERARRAHHAMKAHMARLTAASARKRAARKEVA